MIEGASCQNGTCDHCEPGHGCKLQPETRALYPHEYIALRGLAAYLSGRRIFSRQKKFESIIFETYRRLIDERELIAADLLPAIADKIAKDVEKTFGTTVCYDAKEILLKHL